MKKMFIIFGIALLATGKIAAEQNDIGVNKLTINKTYFSDVEYIIVGGTVKNYGTETVSSYYVYWQLNDGEVFDMRVTNAVLLPNGERAFQHPEPIDPVLPGSHTIKVWTSSPNGQQDEDPDNDAFTFNFIVYDLNEIFRKTVLIEAFTSSTCGPCKAGNESLKAELDKNTGKWALIKYQMSWPGVGDPYYTLEGNVRRSYYSINSVPWAQIEGSAWTGNSGSVTDGILKQYQNMPAFINIQVDMYVEGQTVYTKTKVDTKFDIDNPNLRLYVAIVEKVTYLNKYMDPQSQWNGENDFIQVMKKFMPDAGGIILGNLKEGEPFINVQEWEFKGEYFRPANAGSPINHDIVHNVEDFENLTIVAWIQNIQDKSVEQAANGVSKEHPTVEFICLNNEYGTVFASINGEPVTSGSFINLGDNIVFTASPNEGYEVKEWTVNGEPYKQKSSNSIEVSSDNFVFVSVEFQKKSNINKQLLSVPVFYPNPFTNNLTITNAEKVTAVTITNLLGQTVKTTHFTGTSTVEINTADLAEGIYIITLHSLSGEKTVHKIVKQRK